MGCNDSETITTTNLENSGNNKITKLQKKEQNSIAPALSFVNDVFLSQGQGLQTKGSDKKYSEEDIAHVKEIKYQDGSPLLKLVCFKKGGYLLLNNTEVFKTSHVLYFSDENFDENNINPGLIQYVEEFVDNYEYEKEQSLKQNTIKKPLTKGKIRLYHIDDQDREQTYSIVLSTTSKIVDETHPLLTTAWSQDYPFNESCPIINGKHAKVGCVAVATGQIMNYHKRNLHRNYDWNKINTNDPTTNDLANFLYDIGKGVGMDYGEEESSANSSHADLYFQTSGYRTHRNAFDFEKVKKEITKSKRPVYLFGKSKRTNRFLGLIHTYGGGHAWVADGYKKVLCIKKVRHITERFRRKVSSYDTEETGEIEFIHMNWGWGAYRNVWVTYDYQNDYKLKSNEREGHEYKYKKGMIMCW